jgi:hypothetical protein
VKLFFRQIPSQKIFIFFPDLENFSTKIAVLKNGVGTGFTSWFNTQKLG